MTDWAETGLPEAEVDAFNEVVTTGSPAQIALAVRGLQAQYAASGAGNPPKLITQGTPAGGVTPFKSSDEVVLAMSDKRYANDPAYRAEIEARLERSDLF
jgi:hypothetical protein